MFIVLNSGDSGQSLYFAISQTWYDIYAISMKTYFGTLFDFFCIDSWQPETPYALGHKLTGI